VPHKNQVSMPSVIDGAKMERVSDVVLADEQLAGCKTVAELCARKPDVGSVLLGGNYLGPAHGHLTALTCIVGASYVARCYIVPASSGLSVVASKTDILLPHHATIADLKREVYPHLCIGPEDERRGLDALVCRDSDGNILDAAAQLPKASASACADVGCHASFFFDLELESMGPTTYLEERIEASPLAIERLRLGPGAAYLEHPLSAPAGASFVDVRGELATRLKKATRSIPAHLLDQELKVTVQVFRDIEGLNMHSNLPRAIGDYAQELVDAIVTDDFETLDPEFPKRISGYLAELKTPVEELVLLQKDAHWINYETKTQHTCIMSVRQITDKILENQASVLLHEQDKTHTSPMKRNKANKDSTTTECEDFAGYFEALLKIFDRALTTHSNLEKNSIEHQTNFEKSLSEAKKEKTSFDTQLGDETTNAKLLTDLGTEHTALHKIVCEQIEWCKDFIVSSSADSKKKIEDINSEIVRLTKLKNQEEVRQAQLVKFDTHLDVVQTTENADAVAFITNLMTAHLCAVQRVKKATEGVKQSSKFVEKLRTLHSDVKLELKDAMEYYDLLLKQVGVDCHATFINTGKFLTIQGKIHETNQSEALKTFKAKHILKQQADSRANEGDEYTLERATQAQQQLEKAEMSYKHAGVMVAKNKEVRDKLKKDVNVVFAFLCSTSGIAFLYSTSGTSTPSAITVKNLPILATFGKVYSVSQFRVYRDALNDLAVSLPQAARLHTLDELEVYEPYFEAEFARAEGNLQAQTDRAFKAMAMIGN